MPRPSYKKALDGKSYKIVLIPADVNGILPPFTSFKECPESEGLIIVREKSDALACPVCTEGKKCFQKATVLGHSLVLSAEKEGVTKLFRLTAKQCAKGKDLYIFQHFYNPEMPESPGYPFMGIFDEKKTYDHAFVRVLKAEQFKERCAFCPSMNLAKEPISHPMVAGTIAYVLCKGCWSSFHVAYCVVKDARDFTGSCYKCGSSESEVSLKVVPGCFFMKCAQCMERWLILPEDFAVFFDRAFDLIKLEQRDEYDAYFRRFSSLLAKGATLARFPALSKDQ